MAKGYAAFCLTVDTAHYSRRERDIAKRYVRESRLRATGGDFQKGLEWRTVKLIKDKFKIPLALKGIATAEDAKIALDHGVEWIYVSNHGGRQHDRQAQPATEQFDGGVDLGNVAQDARAEGDLIKRNAVAAHGGFGLGGADNVVPGVLVEVGARLADELVQVLELLAARTKLDVSRRPDRGRLVHLFLPENCFDVRLSPIASRGVTPSQNCMAFGRSRAAAQRFSGFAAAAAADIVDDQKTTARGNAPCRA